MEGNCTDCREECKTSHYLISASDCLCCTLTSDFRDAHHLLALRQILLSILRNLNLKSESFLLLLCSISGALFCSHLKKKSVVSPLTHYDFGCCDEKLTSDHLLI
ncbi:hypothetical protein AB6A40_006780 [Gnathostoma spinigerum]|uniref:Uncharacterized protein n=1 Tax=Gnathostoma spinigerum TaxID=75299 RepID=A0ABD6ELD0_9BILA